jgi:hypothetical protein
MFARCVAIHLMLDRAMLAKSLLEDDFLNGLRCASVTPSSLQAGESR